MANAQNITVVQLARVYLAPVGTQAPSGLETPEEPWRDCGLFTQDSLQFATDPTFEEVRSHQSDYPTRRFQTGDAATMQVDLQEWTAENFKAVYGGGTVTTVTAAGGTGGPVYKFSPPTLGGRDEIACLLDLFDGTRHFRRIIPRTQQIEGVSQTFNKTSESTLPLRLAVLGSDAVLPYYDLTNSPAFAPA